MLYELKIDNPPSNLLFQHLSSLLISVLFLFISLFFFPTCVCVRPGAKQQQPTASEVSEPG